VAWDELSFADAAAWQDIHGSAALRKDMRWYAAAGGTKGTAVADANNADYARIRRAILAGMSDKALREQEVLLQKYVNKLMAVIGNEARNGGARNLELSRLIDYTLFDLFGDLSLGESFGCLDSNDYHPFVKGLVGMGEGLAWLISSRFIPGAEWLLWKLTPKSVRDARDNHLAYSRTQIRKRLELGESPDHPDFVTFMIQDKASESIPLESIEGTFTLLVVAGSETTSTCITAIIRELARYPEKQERLAREVCGRFATADEITVSAIKSLPFLNACIDEGLRLCPPAPLGPRRVTPPEGAIIAGQFIPGKVSIPHKLVLDCAKPI
jgi:cytochrome P450